MKKIGKLQTGVADVQAEIRERTLGYIVAALGLVAGLAWNEAIKSLIEYVFPIGGNTLLAKFAYAVLATIAVVTLTIILARFIKKYPVLNE